MFQHEGYTFGKALYRVQKEHPWWAMNRVIKELSKEFSDAVISAFVHNLYKKYAERNGL